MKILVGYNGGEVGKRALSLARDYAKTHQAFVYVVTSMEGGTSEKRSDIISAQEGLDFAKSFMEEANVACDTQQSVRGLSPGEDLLEFAREMGIDHIFLGIKTKSKAKKAILGSTSRYVILKANCPVTTVTWNVESMSVDDILKDRKILVVDDEPDVLETIEELLDMCSVDTAASFDDAKKCIESKTYDIAILDIMGVRGYDLLALTNERKIPALMLTAHALTPENFKESLQKGADAYIPKNELANISHYVVDVLKPRLEGKGGHGKWFSNLKPFFDKAFGKGWRDADRPFWDSVDDKYGK